MDGSKPGEAGVLAWCNSLRLSIAQDPGREFLDAQIKKQGFGFLDSYLENVFSRPKENTVYDLMKTPGRMRDGTKRTRMAVSTTTKAKANIFLQEDTGERKKPSISDFHKALLEAKAGEHSLESSSRSQPMQSIVSNENTHAPSDLESMCKSATVADSPEVEQMEVDEAPKDVSRDIQLTRSFSIEPDPFFSQQALFPVAEPAVHSQPVQTSNRASTPTKDSTATQVLEPTSIQLVDGNQDDAKTRHTLADPRSVTENEPASSMGMEADEAIDAAPRTAGVDNVIPKELSIIAEGDEPEEMEAVDHPIEMEMTVPLKDESRATSNALKRKPSLSQFSGLPAPSPLRKSMRMSREPSVGTTLFTQQTPGAGTRTSWLSKAREAKALESLRGGRHTASILVGDNSAGIAPSASSFDIQGKEDNRRKLAEGQILGLGFVLPPTPRSGSLDTNSHTQEEVSSRGVDVLNGKHKASSLDGQTQPPMTETTQPNTTSHSLHQATLSPSAHELAGHEEGDVLDRLKKTVENLGARAGVSKAKGTLAEFEEARAAAAARVAQRAQKDGVEVVVEGETERTASAPDVQGGPLQEQSTSVPLASEASQRRFSISELTTVEDQKQSHQVETGSMRSQESHVLEKEHASHTADSSTSTTPPNSPLSSQVPAPEATEASVPAKPVFSKPPSVFSVPNAQGRVPVSNATNTAGQKKLSPQSTRTNPFSAPTAPGITPSLPPSSSAFSFAPSVFSAQTTKASTFSDAVFSKDQSSVPEWMRPHDTDFSVNFNTQKKVIDDGEEDMEEDDSWHMDENFRPDQAWTPFGFTSSAPDEVQDGTDTWSSFPNSTSRKGADTGTLAFDQLTDTFALPLANRAAASNPLPGSDTRTQSLPSREVEINLVDLNPEFDVAQDDIDVDMDVDDTDDVPLDIDDIIAAGKATISLVKPQAEQPRSQSQQSIASSSSSQQTENLGILGQASRFVSSVLGTSKKGPIKSLALATAAAKKQQEEAEKKASRLKDMEQRRQLAQQRKADEEKARLAEEERKAKEDAERRKREREDHTDKRPLLKPNKKDDDTAAKKLKSTTEFERKAESKKPPSKDNQASRSTKPSTAPVTATKAGGGTFKHLAKQPSVTSLAASVQKPSEPKAVLKQTPSTSSLKTPATANAKGKSKALERDDVQPAQMVQSQMAHRAKAHMQATTPRQPPQIASENIELPDINSEYSDSEDEDRPRTFDPPEWAQSPELRQALEQQSHMNPDDIFGRIGPLKMEEIFRTRQSRFRARTSSANWAGPDQLTAEEEREYARRMGFK